MNLKELNLISNSIRQSIIEMLNIAGSGHPGGALGMSEILTTLYFDEMRIDPKKPRWENRDFFILSNGHTCPVLYATLAHRGFFKKSELLSLRKLDSRLQGHPCSDISSQHYTPGVEASSGPLGQGLSQAVGLAASLKRENKKNRVYCSVGDGELEEGQCWEALLFAQKEKLDNLIVIVDYNHIQIDGNPDQVLNLSPINNKFRAFNFLTIELNGNSIPQLKKVFTEIKKIKGKPICLIAKTIPGKGVSFMENDYTWHGKAPNDDETKKALKELEGERRKLENG